MPKTLAKKLISALAAEKQIDMGREMLTSNTDWKIWGFIVT